MGGSATGGAPGVAPPARDAAEALHAAFGEDVGVLAMELHADERGTLSVVDLEALPFRIRRMFCVTDVPIGTRRGGHGHRVGVQALFCLGGRVTVELRRGAASLAVTLRPDGHGLLVAAGVWAQQQYLDADSRLLVLASEPYDPGSYLTTPG